jgi:hypothetical protein
MWLCAKCQDDFHTKQRGAGIDLRFTSNAKLRLIRALKMALLFAWVLLDMLEREIDSGIQKAKSLQMNAK